MNVDIDRGCAGIKLSWLCEEIQRRSEECAFSSFPKFRAALTIQTNYRGWHLRQTIKKWIKNATIIQKYYRAWSQRRRYYELLKEECFRRITNERNVSATKIQSLWRGYWVRLTVHDHRKLKDAQMKAAKELVICIAHKLHYLLRTKQHPGVYSIRNSHCLSKVEELLTALKFREFNKEARRMHAEQIEEIHTALNIHKMKKDHKFKIPYGVLKSYDRNDGIKSDDRKMSPAEMAGLFDKIHKSTKTNDEEIRKRNDEEIKKKCSDYVEKLKSKGDKLKYHKAKGDYSEKLKIDKAKEDFSKKKLLTPSSSKQSCSCSNVCVNVVDSMTKWGIVKDPKNFIVNPSIIQKAENIENFVHDVETIWSNKGFFQC